MYVSGSYYNEQNSLFQCCYRISLLFSFIFLNVLTLIALAKTVSTFAISKTRTEFLSQDFVRCLYWATALTTFICNTFYTATSIRDHFFMYKVAITFCIIHPNCSIPSDTSIYNDEVLTAVAVILVIPSALVIELVVSIYSVKCHFRSRLNLRHGNRYHSWKHYTLQIVHVFALWNIMITIQIIAMVTFPICVLLLINPQVTMLYVIFLSMVPASLMLIVAYLMYQCQQPRRGRICCNVKQCGKKFVQLVAIVAVLGLMMTLLVLYEVILSVQAQVGAGVKGLLLYYVS